MHPLLVLVSLTFLSVHAISKQRTPPSLSASECPVGRVDEDTHRCFRLKPSNINSTCTSVVSCKEKETSNNNIEGRQRRALFDILRAGPSELCRETKPCIKLSMVCESVCCDSWEEDAEGLCRSTKAVTSADSSIGSFAPDIANEDEPRKPIHADVNAFYDDDEYEYYYDDEYEYSGIIVATPIPEKVSADSVSLLVVGIVCAAAVIITAVISLAVIVFKRRSYSTRYRIPTASETVSVAGIDGPIKLPTSEDMLLDTSDRDPPSNLV